MAYEMNSNAISQEAAEARAEAVLHGTAHRDSELYQKAMREQVRLHSGLTQVATASVLLDGPVASCDARV